MAKKCAICGANLKLLESLEYFDPQNPTEGYCYQCSVHRKEMMNGTEKPSDYFERYYDTCTPVALEEVQRWVKITEKAYKKPDQVARGIVCNEEVERVMKLVVADREDNPPVFDLIGCRGRSMLVYKDRVIINTDPTLGAILTSNATDGSKTIFYHDIIGIQFKQPGVTIGYLQLETASGQMNNKASNQFSENTFTFEDAKTAELMSTVRDYITWQVSQYKNINR